MESGLDIQHKNTNFVLMPDIENIHDGFFKHEKIMLDAREESLRNILPELVNQFTRQEKA